MEVCSVFLPFEVDLFQVEQVLVVEDIQGFNFIFDHFLLVVLLLLLSVHLQLCQPPLQLGLRISILVDFLLELVDFDLDLQVRQSLVLGLGEVQLSAE